jgi:hypothetical protein
VKPESFSHVVAPTERLTPSSRKTHAAKTLVGLLALVGTSVGCSKTPSGDAGAAMGPAVVAEDTAPALHQDHVKAVGQLGPGRGTLVISLAPPHGGKLTEGSPLVVEARGEHLGFPKKLRTKLALDALPLRVPVDVADGATGPAYVKLSYFWCGTGDEKACRPERTELVVDLDTSGDAPGGEAHLVHRASGS